MCSNNICCSCTFYVDKFILYESWKPMKIRSFRCFSITVFKFLHGNSCQFPVLQYFWRLGKKLNIFSFCDWCLSIVFCMSPPPLPLILRTYHIFKLLSFICPICIPIYHILTFNLQAYHQMCRSTIVRDYINLGYQNIKLQERVAGSQYWRFQV